MRRFGIHSSTGHRQGSGSFGCIRRQGRVAKLESTLGPKKKISQTLSHSAGGSNGIGCASTCSNSCASNDNFACVVVVAVVLVASDNKVG